MLSYKDKEAERCWTERQRFFHNAEEGDLIYDSGDGTTVERLEDGLRIKVVLSKYQNWRQLADMLRCEVRALGDWAWDLGARGHIEQMEDLEVVERDPMEQRRREDLEFADNDPYDFMYFYDDHHWVVYENDDEYLFLFDLSQDNCYMGTDNLIDALNFTPDDCLGYLISWLGRWFLRVNGYPETED